MSFCSEQGKAAVKIAEEMEHMVIPRRESGFPTQIGIVSGATSYILGLLATMMLQLFESVLFTCFDSF